MKNTNFFVLIFLIAAIVFSATETVEAQLDPTFGTNGISQTNIYPNDVPLKSFLLPNGKILVVNHDSFGGAQSQYSLALFNGNGSLDANYGTNGSVSLNIPFLQPTSGYISWVARQPDGKIILVGNDNNDGLVARFNDNGTLDTSFGNGGVSRPNINPAANDIVTSVAVQTDGRILIAGSTAGSKLFLLRYQFDGVPDLTFGVNGSIVHDLPAPFFNNLSFQSDGSFLVPTTDSVSQISKIYRFAANGKLDAGFAAIDFNFNTIRDLLVQPDDKVLLADAVTKFDTLERVHGDARVSRYHENGAIDTSFGVNGSASVDVASYFSEAGGRLGLLSDGQIVVSAVSNITATRSTLRGSYLSFVRFSANGALSGKFLITDTGEFTNTEIFVLPGDKVLGVTRKLNSSFNRDILMTKATAIPLQNYRFKANPFDFGSFDSFIVQDGKADVTVFRENQSNWYIKPVGSPFYFGLPGDIPIPADFIKDYGTEIAIFRPNTGMWYIARDFTNPGQNFIALPWGRNGDIPIPFDFDGDSKADVSVFRPSEGNWYIRNSSNESVSILGWGMNGDKPVPGDYDGDGKDDIAVWRPSSGVWYILRSSDLQPMYISFGMNGDIPVQEDYDGDGKTDMGIWRPSNGVWHVWRSSDNSFEFLQWGIAGDVPTPSDFDGDLKTDMSVWRPSNRTWYIYRSSSNSSQIFPFGVNSDVPVQRRQ